LHAADAAGDVIDRLAFEGAVADGIEPGGSTPFVLRRATRLDVPTVGRFALELREAHAARADGS
jgi:hypothetical protein